MIGLLYKYPVLGLAFVCLGAYFAWVNAQSYFNLPDAPEKLTLAEIAERLADQKELWVEIQDGQLDCNSLNYYYYENTENKFTEALLVDDKHRIIVFVSHSGYVSCSDFMAEPFVGIISRYRSDWLADKMAQNDLGIQQYSGGLFLDWERGANPPQRLHSTIWGLLMAAFGLTWYSLIKYMHHRKARLRQAAQCP
jgi:hypothetical protein